MMQRRWSLALLLLSVSSGSIMLLSDSLWQDEFTVRDG